MTFAVAPVSSSSPGAAPRTGPERAPILDQRRVNLTRGGEGFRCRESGRRPGPFAGQGAGQGFVDADVGGGVYKLRGRVSTDTAPLPAGFARAFGARPDSPSRVSGEELDGSDPPFLTAGAVSRGGGVYTRVYNPPPLRGGRSRPYLSLREGSPTPGRSRPGRRPGRGAEPGRLSACSRRQSWGDFRPYLRPAAAGRGCHPQGRSEAEDGAAVDAPGLRRLPVFFGVLW